MTGAGPDPARWPVAGPLAAGLVALAVLVGGFGVWAMRASIAGAIVAPGQLEVDQNRQAVQHPDGGVVEAILVRDGDAVAAGDVLIRLDPTLARSELAIAEDQLFEIRARRARLEAERDEAAALAFPAGLTDAARADPDMVEMMDGQARLFAARAGTLAREIEQLGKRKSQIASQIDGIRAQQGALARQLTLIGRELADQQSLLDRGLAQSSRVLALQREEAQIEGRLGELAASVAEAEGRQTEIDIEVLRLRAARREEAIAELRDLRARELELAEQVRSLRERLSRMEIRAPAGGIVYGLAVFAPRAVIRPADEVLFVVPQDRPLMVAARVPVIHIDEVRAGQAASLRFPGIDMRTTPELAGHVVRVSADAFADETTGESWYRVDLSPDPGEIARLDGVALVPGMPVEAFIRTADRSPMSYLLKPLTDYFTRAFRES
jgi:HlyD family type I secretion membrane fusion protein